MILILLLSSLYLYLLYSPTVQFSNNVTISDLYSRTWSYLQHFLNPFLLSPGTVERTSIQSTIHYTGQGWCTQGVLLFNFLNKYMKKWVTVVVGVFVCVFFCHLMGVGTGGTRTFSLPSRLYVSRFLLRVKNLRALVSKTGKFPSKDLGNSR